MGFGRGRGGRGPPKRGGGGGGGRGRGGGRGGRGGRGSGRGNHFSGEKRSGARGDAPADGAKRRRIQSAGKRGEEGSSDDDDESVPKIAGPAAYASLLKSLTASGGAAAASLARWQREKDGESSESGSEEGEEEEEEEDEGDSDADSGGSGGGSDLEGGDDGAGASDGGGDDDDRDDEDDEEEGGAAPRSVEAGRKGHGKAAPAPKGKKGAGGAADAPAAAAPTRAEKRRQAREEAERAAAQEAAEAEAEASGAVQNSFAKHLEAELEAHEVERLKTQERGGGKPAWADAGPIPGVKDCRWEASGGVRDAGPVALKAGPGDYNLPSKLVARWEEVRRTDPPPQQQAEPSGQAPPRAAPAPRDFASPLQAALFAQLDSYRDVHFSSRTLPAVPDPGAAQGDPRDAAREARRAPDDVADACLLHLLGHVQRTRTRVLRNTERLRKREDGAGNPLAPADDATVQDQGFTRPKALLLLPTRGLAHRWVSRMLHLLPEAQGRADAVNKRDRFEREFGFSDDLDEVDALRALKGKPTDFRAAFDGNRDDHFRLGVKITRQSVRLYVDFYGADILIASPLGLATKLEESKDGADFLSSVEVVVVDGADVMAMQNWAHVQSVFGALNGMPKQQRPDIDFMRVRPWYLNGWARHYCQTVLLSAFPTPAQNALLSRGRSNYRGRVRSRQAYGGVLHHLVAAATQTFTRVPASSAAEAADERFEHFKQSVWPRLSSGARRGGDLLFVPSYFDFVRVRNFLKAENASFAPNGEYADPQEVGQYRSQFYDGRVKVMLYSERAHYYRRHRIRGIRRLTFYAPPENAHFYAELVNLLEAPEGGEVSVLFSKWDAVALERLVGTARSKKMLASDSPAFVFC